MLADVLSDARQGRRVTRLSSGCRRGAIARRQSTRRTQLLQHIALAVDFEWRVDEQFHPSLARATIVVTSAFTTNGLRSELCFRI